MHGDDADDVRYRVVVNDEEQWSIWPAAYDLPAGWKGGDKVGTKAECLDYIKTVWTDMRPRSVREFAARQEADWQREQAERQDAERQRKVAVAEEAERERTAAAQREAEVEAKWEQALSAKPADGQAPVSRESESSETSAPPT